MATAVVCEDDPVLRRTVSSICEQVGLHVVAEVDGGADAVELTRRFGVDVLVLDLALGEGISGQETLQALRGMERFPNVIVFTAYAGDVEELLRLGARAVVEKPHLDRLIVALEALSVQRLEAPPGDAPGDERRRRTRSAMPPPNLWRSPSGISSEADLALTLDATAEGDAIIVVRVAGLELVTADAGQMLADDVRLAVARALRATLRTQDVVHQSEAANGFVAVLRGGDTHAPAAVWTRLLEDLDSGDLPGYVVGAYATIGAMGPRDALARAIAASRATSTDARLLISA